jgi:hypothetical protein
MEITLFDDPNCRCHITSDSATSNTTIRRRNLTIVRLGDKQIQTHIASSYEKQVRLSNPNNSEFANRSWHLCRRSGRADRRLNMTISKKLLPVIPTPQRSTECNTSGVAVNRGGANTYLMHPGQ